VERQGVMLVTSFFRSPLSVSLCKSSRFVTRSYSSEGKAFWSHVPKGPEDPILGVTVAFNKDTNPNKINLGVGAYRDDNNKPFILECVRKAEKQLAESQANHEYAGIVGVPDFNKVAGELIFGSDSVPLKEKRVISVQSLSGTGALRIAGAFLGRFLKDSPVYLPTPSWANHNPIFSDSGLQVKSYAYYNPENCGLNFPAMVKDIKNAPSGSVILFHACANNPTGVDPSLENWRELSEVTKSKGHFVLFDAAYQGFASGNPEKDVEPIRVFVKDGHNVAVCQSFAKNFGLYGERIGAFHILGKTVDEALAVESQLKILIRPMYSNPPIYGARLVANILNNTESAALWRKEVKIMADRIIGMRTQLVDRLKAHGSTRDWKHIKDQIGMFCYTGLTPEQVDKLTNDHHVYLTRNGRISIAGVTSKNVDYLAKSIHAVTS